MFLSDVLNVVASLLGPAHKRNREFSDTNFVIGQYFDWMLQSSSGQKWKIRKLQHKFYGCTLLRICMPLGVIRGQWSVTIAPPFLSNHQCSYKCWSFHTIVHEDWSIQSKHQQGFPISKLELFCSVSPLPTKLQNLYLCYLTCNGLFSMNHLL